MWKVSHRHIYFTIPMANSTTNNTGMTKKQIVLKVLEKLQDDFPAAWGLRILVESGHLDGELLDTIYTNIAEAAANVKDIWLKKKLQAASSVLERVALMEAEDRLQDEKDLLEMEQMLELIA